MPQRSIFLPHTAVGLTFCRAKHHSINFLYKRSNVFKDFSHILPWYEAIGISFIAGVHEKVCLMNVVHRQATVDALEAADKFVLLATTKLLEIKTTYHNAGKGLAIHHFERDLSGQSSLDQLQLQLVWHEGYAVLHLQYGPVRMYLLMYGTVALDVGSALYNWLSRATVENWPDHLMSFFEGMDPFRTPNKFRELLA